MLFKRYLLICLFTLIAFSSKSQKLNQKIFDIKLPVYFDEYNRKLIIDKDEFKILKENSNFNIKILKDKYVYEKDSLNNILKTQLSYYALEYVVSFLFYLPNNEFEFKITVALTENLYVLYFVDNNQNLLNKNSFYQIRFNKKLEHKVINTSYNNINYIIRIINPYYQEKKQQNYNQFINNTKKIHLKLGFSGGVAYGFSEMSYTPTLPDSVFSIYYNADIRTAYFFKMHINSSYKNINLSCLINYQNLDFETNTRAISSISSTKKTYTNFSQTGFWPSKLLYLTLSAYYDFRVKNIFFLAPTISFSHYLYINANKYFDESQNGNIENNFNNRYSYSLGLKLKYAINYKYSLFLASNYTTNLLDASSYFNNIDKNTYISRQVTNNFEFGFYYRIM